MRPKTAVLAGLVVVIGVLAWIARDDARLTRTAETTLDAVARKRAAVDQQILGAKARFAVAAQARSAFQTEADVPPKNKNSPDGAAPPKKASASFTEEIKAFLQKQQTAEKDPRIQVLQFAARRAQLATTFGLLFRKLGLTPGQIEKFQDNFVHREEQVTDLMAIMREQGLTLTDPVLAKLWRPIEPEYQAAQRELLGEDGYRQLQNYDRTATVRNMVSDYAGATVVTGVPLTGVQAEQLVQIMAKASAADQKGGRIQGASVDWAVVDAQAATILSPEQLAFFKEFEGPNAGRFWGQLSKVVNEAQKADAANPTVGKVHSSDG